jgi:DNA-binding CsgD family transcriptional regulator
MEQLLVAPPKATPLAVFRRGLPAASPRPRLPATDISRVAAETVRPASSQPEPRTEPIGAAEMPAIVQSILDSIQIGAMAVCKGMRVSFANRAAVRECRRRALLHIHDAQVAVLAPASEAEQARMTRAVEGAHAGQWSLVRLGAGAASLSIAVFPLRHGERTSGPLALLLFGLSQSQEPLAIQLYAGSCGLTPAETRVLLGLAEGLVPKQIASKHDVLLSTVRTQISSIRDKTGTRRLSDLMQALVSLPPIMPRT